MNATQIKKVSTRQAYFFMGFSVLGAVVFLVVFLTGAQPFSKPVDLILLGVFVLNTLIWLYYVAGGYGSERRGEK